MNIEKYLVVTAVKSRYGGYTARVELREREPKLKGDQLSLLLRLEVPNALFERPKLRATMKVPDEAVPQVNITPEITTNIEAIIRERTGLEMVVTLVDQPQEEKADE
jgi:hypothetical protein